MTILLASVGFPDPSHYVALLGPWLLLVVFLAVATETGVPFGVFVPGDSLLFACGVLAASAQGAPPLAAFYAVAAAGAILGGVVGYRIGERTGDALFSRGSSAVFSRANLESSHRLFERYGSWAVLGGRFVPVLRTFAPIFAGIAHMAPRKFHLFNVVGALVWALWMPTLGYAVTTVPFIHRHLHLFVVALVVVAVAASAVEGARRWRAADHPKG